APTGPEWDGTPWVEWPQGVFLLSTPNRDSDAAGVVRREVEAYDQLQVYVDDKVTDRFIATVGDRYTDVVSGLLGAVSKNITASELTLPYSMEWEPGTSKLTIINELLAAINYDPVFFDEFGQAVVRPYQPPHERARAFVYRDDADGVILPEVSQKIDLFQVPNVFVLSVSNPEMGAPLRSVFVNDSPQSPTSTISRGRQIVEIRTEEEAADQATLDALAERAAIEASQVFEEVEFETVLMPIHGHNDMLGFSFGNLVINDRYLEVGWEMELRAGSTMKHTIRRVVDLSGN